MGSRLLILFSSLFMFAACSPEPIFRLSPQEGPTFFYKGEEYITLEHDSLFVTMAYYRHMDNMFAMDTEVYNKRDTTVRVDPAKFGTIALGSNTDSMLTDFLTYERAIDPEKQLLDIDKRISRDRASDKTTSAVILASAGIAITAAILLNDGSENNEGDDNQYTFIDYGPGRDIDYEELELRQKREIWELDALRITDLQPGEYIRGFVFFDNVKDAAGYKLELNIGDSQFTTFYLQHKIKP